MEKVDIKQNLKVFSEIYTLYQNNQLSKNSFNFLARILLSDYIRYEVEKHVNTYFRKLTTKFSSDWIRVLNNPSFIKHLEEDYAEPRN